MTFAMIAPGFVRRHRSELAVPAIRPELFAKAASSEADVVFLDLEDAVAPARKAEARENAVAATRDIDWGAKTLAVRINGLDTPLMYQDVLALIERGGPRLDLLIIPKIGEARDCYALDMLVTQAEAAVSRPRRLGFALIIETALGLANADTIAMGSPRVESLQMGVADLAASLGMKTVNIGGPLPDYTSSAGVLDAWHYPMMRVVTAARAAGRRPIAGPYGDFRDVSGLAAAAARARALGCEGMMAIHPSQVAAINAAFTPDAEELAQARRVLAAMQGEGAVQLDGRLLDLASIRQAEALLTRAGLTDAG